MLYLHLSIIKGADYGSYKSTVPTVAVLFHHKNMD